MSEDSFCLNVANSNLSESNLNSKNSEEVWLQILSYLETYGSAGEKKFLRELISSIIPPVTLLIDNSEPLYTNVPSPPVIPKLHLKDIVKNKYKLRFFDAVFCQALQYCFDKSGLEPADFHDRFCKVLDLNFLEKVLCALALLYPVDKFRHDSCDRLAKEQIGYLIIHVLTYKNTECEISASLLSNVEYLYSVLKFIRLTERRDWNLGSDFNLEEELDSFWKVIREHFPLKQCPDILCPLLYLDDLLDTDFLVADSEVPTMESETSSTSGPGAPSNGSFDTVAVEFLLEHGLAVCSNVEEMRTSLLTIGIPKLTPAVVARIMNGFWKAYDMKNPGSQNSWNDPASSGKGVSDSSWNLKPFVQAVLDLVPSLAWKDVIRELDFGGVYVRDGKGFRGFIEALKFGMQLQGQTRNDQFPIDLFYRRWSNAEAQTLFLKAMINPNNADVFYLLDHPYRAVQTDMLKTSGDKNYDSKEIAVWKSLDLVDSLLNLSDAGQFPIVQEMFQFPINHCPDLLLISLIQIQSPMNVLRQELMGALIPIFLGNHINSGIVLQYSWHNGTSSIRPIMIHAMAEWYLRGEYDQTKLSRILDVAQDLKALPLLLNANSHVFIIDLAILASRREFLKLDKWLTDKIREHGEPFVASMVKVLNRRVPIFLGAEETVPKSAQLAPETIKVLMSCLHQCVGKVSQELSDTIMTMTTTIKTFVNKRVQSSGPQHPPGVLRPQHRGLNADSSFNASPGPFPSQSDPLSSIGSTFGGLNLGGNSSSGSFGYNPLGPTPGSPSRLLGPGFNSQNPAVSAGSYPVLSGLQLGPNAGAPNVANVSAALMGGMNNPMSQMLGGRLAPNSQGPTAPGNQAPISTPASTAESRTRPNDSNLILNDMGGEISKEAEDEANNYFHRIYSKPPDPTMSIDEILDLLKRFQESNNRKETQVFKCMLRNLFEEYKFFPQYPDKELHTTAQLFGGIIEHGLVSTYLQLGVALRFVVDALKKPPGNKMYFFGLTAIDRFKNRLKEYPQYCQHVSTISHFREFPAHIIEYIEYGARSQDPPGVRSTGSVPPLTTSSAPVTLSQLPAVTNVMGIGSKGMTTSAQTPSKTSSSHAPGPSISGRPSIANATNITTLLVATEKEETVKPPPEQVQDKTAFIFNNLNQMNLTQKCEELKEVIGNEYWPWVAQYLVMKRASIELNFHSLYSNLLDTLKANDLNSCVLRETHRNIRILLKSDKSASNFSDRALLKNLGHWLGMITVLKNKAIMTDDLDIKSLIIEAYRKGLQDLLYVVPFAAKIMESCARSKVFSPPSPWTMGILNVLAELHQEPDMKLNLKFEIEVLCKTLSIEMRDLRPPGLLKDEVAFKILVYQLSYGSSENQIQRTVTTSAEPPVQKPQPAPEVSQPQLPTSAPTPQPAPLDDIRVAPTPPPAASHHSSQSVMSGLSSTPTLPAALLPEPKFSYMDIDTSNINSLLSNITVNGQLPLFQAHPQLKQLVRQAVEKAITDLLHPVVDRSIKYTINACEQLIKKDFALDYEETRMRTAAHHMMRYLTAGMAMITSRDHIFIAIGTNLKTMFSSQIRSASENQQVSDMIEQASSVIANDNMEIACVFIQKAAVEKGLAEIDKRLTSDYEVRKQAKLDNKRYYDHAMLAYQNERIPEPIRVKPVQPGGAVSAQLAVYEDFSRNIPGFIPPTEGEVSFLLPRFTAPGVATPASGVSGVMPVVPGPQNVPGSGEDLLSIYDKLVAEMESYLQGLAVSHFHASPQLAQGVRSLTDAIVVARTSQSVVGAITLLQKAVEGLLEGFAYPNDPEIIRYRDAHLMVLKALQDDHGFGQTWVNRQVTKCLIESRPELKHNVEAVDTLIRANLVNMIQFDAHLASAMDKGANVMAVNFAMQLVQMYLVDERFNTTVTESDLYHTVDMLSRCATVNRQHPEGLIHLIEVLRNHETPNFAGDRPTMPITASNLHTAIGQSRDYDDSQEKSEMLFREWIRLYVTQGSPKDSTKPFSSFIHDLNSSGILKSDDVITRFFRVCIQFCVSQVYQGLQAAKATSTSPAMPVVRTKCYQSVDALVRLVALLIRHIGDSVTTGPKVNLLNKFLGIVAGLLIQDHEAQKQDFQQLPFHRVFIMLFLDLNQTDPVYEAIGMQVLAGFSNILHILSPLKVSGFVYAWLEIIGNRVFIQKMLALASDQKCWAMYCQLLLDLFKFLQPYLRNADLAKPVATLYRGTLRVLLVILHDFPDFLCDYCYHFLDAIPPNCIQMRNLVLSAFPRNMRLPDPFTANLKFEMLPDTALPPRIILNVAGIIQPLKFKQDLESYLRTRAPVTFLSELRTNLQVSNEPGSRYNITLLNALVLFVGSQHITAIRNRNHAPSMSTIAHTSHMDIFQNMAVDLDTEGRYLFLNALTNQLRFPSSHTHYFSLVILYLFAHSNTEVVQEQITRVLLERLVVNRPHPWGLLVTFIELIKNPAYKFWQHDFVHCAPEVEKLFESVARSCMVTKNAPLPSGSSQSAMNLSSNSSTGTGNGPSLMSMESGSDILNME